MRIEGNVSLRPMGSTAFGTKVEVKNLNSFRSLERALEFEVARHAEALERGEPLVPGDARLGRGARPHDHPAQQGGGERLPLLPGARPAAAAPIRRRGSQSCARRLPELPAQRRARYIDELGLSAYDAGVLTADAALAAYFDAVVEAGVAPKAAANWITGEFSRLLNQHAADGLRADQRRAAARGARGAHRRGGGRPGLGDEREGGAGRPSSRAASRRGRSIERDGLGQVSDAGAIGAEIDGVLAEFASQVEEYRSGKPQLFGFLVGQVMKRTAGRADARLVNEELRRRLDSGKREVEHASRLDESHPVPSRHGPWRWRWCSPS